MRDERREIGQLLRELSPDQWQKASLCDGWSVRDVVAHLQVWDDLLLYRNGPEHVRVFVRFMGLYLRSLGSMRRVNQRLDAVGRDLSPEDLVVRFGADDGPELKWLFDGSNPGAHLAEYVIHHNDIRDALDSPRQLPPQRLIAALDGAMKLPGVRARARWRLARERWQADNVGWSRGRGREVRASGEHILMALAGRESITRSTNAAGDS